jgi:hypothetical protein
MEMQDAIEELSRDFKKSGVRAFMALPKHWNEDVIRKDAERDPEPYSVNVSRAIADLYRGEKLADVLRRYSVQQRSITVKLGQLEKRTHTGKENAPISSDNSATRQWKLKIFRGQLLKALISKSGKPELDIVVEALEGLLASKYGASLEQPSLDFSPISIMEAAKADGKFYEISGHFQCRELVDAAVSLGMQVGPDSTDDTVLMALYSAV